MTVEIHIQSKCNSLHFHNVAQIAAKPLKSLPRFNTFWPMLKLATFLLYFLFCKKYKALQVTVEVFSSPIQKKVGGGISVTSRALYELMLFSPLFQTSTSRRNAIMFMMHIFYENIIFWVLVHCDVCTWKKKGLNVTTKLHFNLAGRAWMCEIQSNV